MSSDLVEFLRACIDADEEFARTVSEMGTRQADGLSVADRANAEALATRVLTDPAAVTLLGKWTRSGVKPPNDLARVLAECDAKRRIIDEHPVALGFDGEAIDAPVCRTCAEDDNAGDLCGDPYPCTTLRLLALPYADHPDWREEWRP